MTRGSFFLDPGADGSGSESEEVDRRIGVEGI
jgi:hypothetical protein